MDLHGIHERIRVITAVSYEQMVGAATAIATQPDRAMLGRMLGLDGVPTRLNAQAKSRYKKEQATL